MRKELDQRRAHLVSAKAPPDPMRTPVRSRMAQERRRALILAAMAAAAVVLAGVLASAELGPSAQTRGATAATRVGDFRSATVITEGPAGGCRERVFDNQTGRMADATSPCGGATVLDENGVPVPVGTLHRMDAISRSFNK